MHPRSSHLASRGWGGLLLGAGVLAAACAAPVRVERAWPAMGGEIRAEVWASTERTAVEILDAMQESTTEADSVLDASRASSEIRLLNELASGDAYVVQNRDLYRCARLALDYAKASGGAFDPTVGPLTRLYDVSGGAPAPDAIARALEAVDWRAVVTEREALAVRFLRPGMELDLGGLAPGYALDIAARNFALPGSRAGLLRDGRHAYAWGEPRPGKLWTIPVPDPRDPARSLGAIEVSTRGVAVSARHPPSGRLVLDPRNGQPADTDVEVAIALADSAADADAVSTVLVVAGSLAAGKFLAEVRRVEAVLLVRRGAEPPYLLASASLRGRFRPSDALKVEVGERIRYLLPPETLDSSGGGLRPRDPGLLDDAGVR